MVNQSASEAANKISEDTYIHNSGGNLNPNVARTMRIDLITRIESALKSFARQELAKCLDEICDTGENPREVIVQRMKELE